MRQEMTPTGNSHSKAVLRAAQWLADQNPSPAPIIPALRQRFKLTALEATEAAALSHSYRVLRAANG